MFDKSTNGGIKAQHSISDMYTQKKACRFVTADVSKGKANCTAVSLLVVSGELSLLLGYLVCSVSPKHGSWTGVRPLLEQRPRRCGVCTRLCFVTLGQAA